MSDAAVAVGVTLPIAVGGCLTFAYFRYRNRASLLVGEDLANRSRNYDIEAQNDLSQTHMTNLQRSNARRTKNHAWVRPAVHEKPPARVVVDDAGPSRSSNYLNIENHHYHAPVVINNLLAPAKAHNPKKPVQSSRPKRIKVQVDLDEASTQCSESTKTSFEPIIDSKAAKRADHRALSRSEFTKKLAQSDTPDRRLTLLRYKYDRLLKGDCIDLISDHGEVDIKRARELIKQLHQLGQDSEKIAPISASDDLKKAKEAFRSDLNKMVKKLGDYIRS